jgi:hypothetical protein
METQDETIFEDFIVTCRTKGCENEKISIEVPIDISLMLVYCGPCSLPIKDIVPVKNLSK